MKEEVIKKESSTAVSRQVKTLETSEIVDKTLQRYRGRLHVPAGYLPLAVTGTTIKSGMAASVVSY